MIKDTTCPEAGLYQGSRNIRMGPPPNGTPLLIFAYAMLVCVILCATVQDKLKIRVLVCGVQNKILCGSVALPSKLFDFLYFFIYLNDL